MWKDSYYKKWSFTSVMTSLEIFCYLSCALAVSVLFGFGLFKALNTRPNSIQGFAGFKVLQNTKNYLLKHKLALEIFTTGINSKSSANN